MENNRNNAQLLLSKHTGLNDESAMGVAVLNAMVEYAKKCSGKSKIETAKNAPLVSVSNSLDLRELERRLDVKLSRESKETLAEWLKEQRL